MDAAYKFFNKTVLFLATALLMVATGRAQTFNLGSSNSNTVPVSLGSQSTGVSVASSDGTTAITFTTGTVYTGTNQPGPNWLSVSGGLTTPTTLYFSVGQTAGMQSGQTYTAVVTLTSASPAITGTINVSYAFGSTSGGGTVNPSSTSVVLNAAPGVSTSATVSLTTASATAISFSAMAQTSSGTSWLTATADVYSISSATFAILTIGAPNGMVLSSGTYYGTVTITPTSGGSATQIGVTYTVGSGGGTGTLSANPSTISWSYTSGSGVYPSSSVTLSSSTGAATFSATMGGSTSWMYTNPSGSNSPISGGIQILPNAAISSLSTGNYTGYIYVTASDGATVTITVNLSVNGGTSTGISWSPNPATITAAVSGTTQQVQVNLSSATSGTFSASVSGSGLYVSGVYTSTTTPASGYVIVYGNPSGLSANTYTGNLLVTLTPTSGTQVSQSIPVSFFVGTGGGTTTPGIVTPTSLTFSYQTGTTVTSTTLPSQNIVLTGTGTYSVAAPAYASGQPTGWLATSPTGTTLYGPGTIAVSITNPGALAAGSYTATVAVTPTGSSSTTVSVTLLVAAGPVLVAYPGSLNFTYTGGGVTPYSSLYLNSSDNSAIPVVITTSTTWLSVGTPTQPNTSTVVTVQGNNVTSLANGVYSGTVVVTAAGAANSPVTVPVVLTVTGSTATGGGDLTLGTSSMTFNATQGGTAPVPQTLSVTASGLTYYTATATSTGNWLSISPSGSLNTSSNPSLAVSVNQSGLTAAASPYYGTITLVANGATQTVQVTMAVGTTSTGGSGNVTVTANSQAGTPSMAFTYQVGGGAPTVQTLQVASASGSSPVAFTIASSATWLSAGVTNGTSLNTPANLTVSIMNPSSLAAGPYSATITITPNGGTVVTIPVSLSVNAAPTVSVTSPTTLSFSYQAGNANPTPATIDISGGGASLPFTVQVTSGSNWLSASPTSGTTPTTGTTPVTVTATPGNLGAGTYTGTILVVGSGIAIGSTSINVNLTVTAPLPTINSVVNAASFIRGSISPGEIVTLFGTALGPAAAAYATIDDSTGRLATTIGGVQVLFNGIPAPMIYASATQVSAIVPYEMAPISSPSVWIKYVGQTSNAYLLISATTMPGIFTQNASGSGPGAILNQDYSLNGPGNAAAKGSIVMVFMTGEGQTSPKSVTGAITTPTLPAPQVTPAPLLPIGVLINGQPALYTYAGEAPGLAGGLLQLNVQIPPNAQSGNLSITVSIGGNISQNNVTVSVSGASSPNAQCATFPSNLIPFVSQYYVTGPNTAGDRLFVGQATRDTWNQLLQLPTPAFQDQRFCGAVQLASGVMATVYVPTSAERNGDFSPFAGLLLDPLANNLPFPGGQLPMSRIPNPWAMRVVSVP